MASWKRARTADREAAVELINTAYVDGQLSDTERDDKVARALVARTIGEVQQTTADLQDPHEPSPPTAPSVPVEAPAQAPGQTPTPTPTSSPTSSPASSPGNGLRSWWTGRSRAARIGIAAAIVVPLAAGSWAVLDQPEAQPGVAQTGQFQVSVDIETVTDLLADYESRFSTTRTYGVIVMRDFTRVLVPTEDGKARYEQWTLVADNAYELRDTRGASDLQELDLADVDLGALAATIDEAESGLGVEDPNRTDVIIDHQIYDDQPRIQVTVANRFGEDAYLVTDLAGNVITREPLAMP